MRPDDIEARAAKQDGLRHRHVVGIGRQQHDVLNELRHAFARRQSAGQHLQRQQHQHQQQTELRHRARHRRQENAERAHREQHQRAAGHEQRHGAVDGHAENAFNYNHEGKRRGHEDNEADRPDLADHDFKRRDRHHQKVLDRAMLALADQRRARKDHRQHGDAGDDVDDRAEPHLAELRIVAGADIERDRNFAAAGKAVQIFADGVVDDLLDVGVAGKGLRHARGVDIELQLRLSTGKHIPFEIRRDIEHEGGCSAIQPGVHLGGGNDFRLDKIGGIEGIDNALRQRRAILIDNRDRRAVKRFRHRRGLYVDGQRKGVDDQDDHQRVAAKPP